MKCGLPPTLTRNKNTVVYYNTIEQNLETREASYDTSLRDVDLVQFLSTVVDYSNREADQIK
jgi:hypothetical protein